MLALLALIPVQEAPPASPSPAQLEEVEVVGRRGAARVAPEQELGPEEIDNLGAYDIGEVIARLTFRSLIADAHCTLRSLFDGPPEVTSIEDQFATYGALARRHDLSVTTIFHDAAMSGASAARRGGTCSDTSKASTAQSPALVTGLYQPR